MDEAMGVLRDCRCHLDEMFLKINGVEHYLWRAVDHEGEVLESHFKYKHHLTSRQNFMDRRDAELTAERILGAV